MLSPQPQEALEDSPHLSDGFVLEDGDLSADPLKWHERSTGGGDTSDEYFDSCSWNSDTLSDWSPNREDSPDTLLGLGDTRAAQPASGGCFHTGQSKPRRREAVTAKDAHRDSTETYVRQGSCNRRKSPENHVDLLHSTDIQSQSSNGELSSIEIQPCQSTEHLKPDLHQEQSILQTGFTRTQISTDTNCLHAQSQHSTDIHDTKVNDHADTQEAKTQPGENEPTKCKDPETCTVQIETTEDKTTERLDFTRSHTGSTDRHVLEICGFQGVEVENIDLLSIKEGESLGHQNAIGENGDIQVSCEDKKDLCKSLFYNKAQNKIENNVCRANTQSSDVINTQTSKSPCTPTHFTNKTKHTDSHVITEIVETNPNIPEDTQTNSVPHNTTSEVGESFHAQISVLAQKGDICCSQSQCEEIISRETQPQVCASATKPREEVLVSGVGLKSEHCGCVGTKSPGTVNEIWSSITSSTDSTALFPLDACGAPILSQLASPVPEAGPDREELTQRQPDQTEHKRARSRPGLSQDLIPHHLDLGCAWIEIPSHKQIQSEDKLVAKAQSGCLEAGPVSTQTHSDTGKGSEGCLPPHPFLASSLFPPIYPEEEDSFPLLSERLGGERGRVGSLCSLSWQNTEQEGEEGGHVYLDQRKVVSRVSLTISHTGTTLSDNSELRVVPRSLANTPDSPSTQHVSSEIEKTTGPTAAEPSQNSFTAHSGQTQVAVSPTNTISRLCEEIQPELEIPQPPCGVESPSLLSDSNNNTKASAAGTGRGQSIGISESNEKTIPPPIETLTRVTSDLLDDIDSPQKNCLDSLDYEPNRSSEGSAVSGRGDDLDSHSHLGVAEVVIKDSAFCTQVDTFCKNSLESIVSLNSVTQRNEGLEPLLTHLENKSLLVDSECKEDRQLSNQSHDHSVPYTKISSSSESFEEHKLVEEGREHTQTSTVKCLHSDVGLHLLSISSLEPILEAECSQESPGTAQDDLEIETRKDQKIMRPAVEDRDIVNFSRDIGSPKSPNCQPVHEEETLTNAESEPELNAGLPDPVEFSAPPVLRNSADRHCRPMTVAYDTVSYTASSSCDETEETKTKRSKIKGSQTGNRGSKFSVFAKMPSFRKAKGLKSAKGEESPKESSGSESLPCSSPLPEHGLEGDNSDDEVFLKSNILNQTVQQFFSSETEEEEYGFFPSAPYTCHVPQLSSQGSSGEGNGGLSQENPLLRQVQLPDGQTYKRSKSNDSLNIRMRFAQAHKSLSSLFESRSLDKENQEQANMGTDGDFSKAKQSWKKFKKAKEAELLRRTLSVPDEECSTGNEQDYSSSSLLNRLSNPGSPSSLRALRHTDPISKRGVPQESGKDKPHGCKSEGQRRKHSPNGLPGTLHESGPPTSSDESLVPPLNDSSPLSPLSPSSLATHTHLHSPSTARSPPVASEGVTETPLRPMSPKPNSPRPAAQRKVFRYPHSIRAGSLSLMGQSVSVEGLTDPPERPKTLKPSASPLALSPLEAAESRLDSQSHISLYAIGSISELEVRMNQLVFSQ